MRRMGDRLREWIPRTDGPNIAREAAAEFDRLDAELTEALAANRVLAAKLAEALEALEALQTHPATIEEAA